MPDTVVDICNRALALIGARSIQALDQSGDIPAACNRLYGPARDVVLRAYPWNCAVRRARLGAATEKPAFGFERYFRLPEGPDEPTPYALRVLRVRDDLEQGVVWKLEGRFIATDEPAPLDIVYIGRVLDPAGFDPGIADALAARLAMDLSVRVTDNTALGERLAQLYRERLLEARRTDAQEGNAEPIVADDWTGARR
jgi:hypothetical protein